MRPIDPNSLDYCLDDWEFITTRADLLSTIALLQRYGIISGHPMKLSREVVNSLPAKKQVHWLFAKDYGLNDTDNESQSDEETWFDSFSSDSDPEAEFY